MTDTTPVIGEGQLDFAEFRGTKVRRVLQSDEWYFSVVDVIEAVSESKTPRRYWSELKATLRKEGADDQLFDNIEQLKMPSADGKMYATDTANTETMFRIVQSIPSKKVELLKRWLARVGYERILEAQNPDIAVKRAILNYRILGYDDKWIDARMQSIATRHALTGEWSRRGVKDGPEFATLTDVVQKGTFGLGAAQHRAVKNIKKSHNLRDHMTNTELIFTMLGETATKEIAVEDDARGFVENKKAAKAGGTVAGDARIALERRLNRRVVSEHNFLPNRNQKKLGSGD